MSVKEKVIGVLLMIVGAWPFILKIKPVGDYFAKYTFLNMLTPGEIIYQAIILVLGFLLIYKIRQAQKQ